MTVDAVGTYQVSLTSFAAEGFSTSVSQTINVTNVAPTATPASSTPQTANQAVVTPFALGSFSDPGPNDGPWTVDVNWGDGSPDTIFTTLSQGSLGNLAHAFDLGGPYNVNVSVTDSFKATGSSSFAVNVAAVPPSATILNTPTTGVNVGTPITLGSSVSDFSKAEVAAGYTYSWSVTDNGLPVALPPGTITNAANFTFTPLIGGNTVVSLVVTDMSGSASTPATAAFTVIANLPPTATIANLPPGNTSNAGTTITLDGSATEPGQTSFTFNWSVSGPNGFSQTGSSTTAKPGFSFTPEDGGGYLVTLTATDQNSLTSTPVSQIITIQNVAPTATIANLPPGNTSNAGTTITLNGSAADPSTTDVAAGFAFKWTVAGPNGFSQTGSSTTAKPGFSFTPEDGGGYLVTLTATDQNSLTSTPVSQTITIQNVAPTATIANLPPGNTSNAGTTVTLNGSATDPSTTDVAAGFSFQWTVVGPNNFSQTGSSTTAKPGFSFTPEDGGGYLVTLTATDHDNLTSTPVSQTITIQNVAPTVSISGAPATDNVGTPITLTGSATDPSTTDVAAGFTYAWQRHG